MFTNRVANPLYIKKNGKDRETLGVGIVRIETNTFKPRYGSYEKVKLNISGQCSEIK